MSRSHLDIESGVQERLGREKMRVTHENMWRKCVKLCIWMRSPKKKGSWESRRDPFIGDPHRHFTLALASTLSQFQG